MQAIYVLSDPDSVKQGKYKIGITKRKKELLLNDYRRSRPEVILYLFENCENSKELETFILKKFEKYRIKHQSGKLSEWVKVDVYKITKEIHLKLTEQSIKQIITNEVIVTISISDYIKNKCNLSWGYSESCKSLYDEYIQEGGTMNKMNFCKVLLYELSAYYKCNKDAIRYKVNKLTYYKGIQLKTNQASYTCFII